MDEVRAKVRALYDAEGIAPDMVVDLIIDAVKSGLGKLGGRPRLNPVVEAESLENPEKKRVIESTEPVMSKTEPVPSVSKPLSVGGKGGSESGSLSPSSALEDPDQTRVGRSASRALGPGPGLFERLLGDFRALWAQAHEGTSYVITGQDRKALGAALKAVNAGAEWDTAGCRQEFCRGFRNYLASLDKFDGEAKGHSLAWFCTSGGLNKYRAPPARTAGVSQKSIETMGLIHRAVQRGGGT